MSFEDKKMSSRNGMDLQEDIEKDLVDDGANMYRFVDINKNVDNGDDVIMRDDDDETAKLLALLRGVGIDRLKDLLAGRSTVAAEFTGGDYSGEYYTFMER